MVRFCYLSIHLIGQNRLWLRKARTFALNSFRWRFARYKGKKFISAISFSKNKFLKVLQSIYGNGFKACAVQSNKNSRFNKPQTQDERGFPLGRGCFSSHYSSRPAPFLLGVRHSIGVNSYQGQKARLSYSNNQTNPNFSQYRGLKHELRHYWNYMIFEVRKRKKS